jgi:thiol-disulfide isomerase/thioredoxin
MKIVLLFFLVFYVKNYSFSQKNTQPNANQLIQKASVTAIKEHKKIFVKFTASWCGWCHKMEDAMKDSTTIKLFNNNYEIVYITVQETPQNKNVETSGGFDVMKKYGGENSGLPYWVVLNENGNLIANSKVKVEIKPLDADGDNAGCPAEKNEIEYFIRVLKTTSNLNELELALIKKRFEKIKNN